MRTCLVDLGDLGGGFVVLFLDLFVVGFLDQFLDQFPDLLLIVGDGTARKNAQHATAKRESSPCSIGEDGRAVWG